MQVIGFFQNVLDNVGGLVNFITIPLGQQFDGITIEPFASMSIINMLGVGLVTTLGVLIVIHVIRLFIGG